MYCAYIRRSTDRDDRQALSIEGQKKSIEELAKRDGLSIERFFIDKASARKPDNRPEFAEMIRLIKKKKFKGIYTWKLNRLSRNPIEAGEVIYALTSKQIEQIRCTDGGRTYKPEDNVLMMNVEFGMADQNIRDMITDIERGMSTKFKNGGWIAYAPLGYLNDKNTNSIVHDKERAPLIRKAFEMRSSGMTEPEIVKSLYKLGLRTRKGKKVPVSTINMILKNNAYLGMVKYKGEWNEGEHEPIVDQRLWNMVQRVNRQNAKTKRTFNTFDYKGFLSCGLCGYTMTAENQKGRYYYKCSHKGRGCKSGYIREDKISEIITDYLSKLIIPDEIIEKFEEEGGKRLKEILADDKKIMKQYNPKITRLEEKLYNLKEMRLDGDIGREEFLADRAKYSKDLTMTKKERDKKLQNNDISFNDLKNFIELLEKLYVSAKTLNHSSQVTLLRQFGLNFFIKDGKLFIEGKTPLLEAIEKHTLQYGGTDYNIIELIEVFVQEYQSIKHILLNVKIPG